MGTLLGQATNDGEVGVTGESSLFEGVRGTSHAKNHGGVVGTNDSAGDDAGPGVFGESLHGEGVRGFGHSDVHAAVVGTCNGEAAGIYGESTKGEGVRGWSHNPNHGGVVGVNDAAGSGVFGQSDKGRGVEGSSKSFQGVYGHSETQAGVVGESDGFDGVFGISHNPAHAGVSGHNPGGLAGYFEGDVVVTGDIRLSNADCAEDFEIGSHQPVEPGTVMAFGKDGALLPCHDAYDRRVAGVISGAGAYKPGIVLDKRETDGVRQPVALMGKVFCKVDAQFGSIEVGDMLTSSDTPGHAMKVVDPSRAFGAVIGKALARIGSGTGLIPILVSLQ